MIAVHMLDAGEVAKRLMAVGCTPVETPLPDHTAWVTAYGKYFLVPTIPPDGMTAEYKLDKIIESIELSRPTNH